MAARAGARERVVDAVATGTLRTSGVTVAVSCNLSEGVILGVDSAATVATPQGSKVYDGAEKLFQLGELPVGVAIYGLGALGARSIGSFLNEFESTNPGGQVQSPTDMSTLVEALRQFFFDAYRAVIVPALEQVGKTFEEIPRDQLPSFGLIVGGFAPKGAYLSEVWNVIIPAHDQPGSATCYRQGGNFGTNWFAMCGPILRYVKGFDPALLGEVFEYLRQARGLEPLSEAEQVAVNAILAKHEYPIPFAGMPLSEGVEHVRFLTELVVNHHRYAVGERVVGGRVQLGKVTYRGGQFQLLDPERVR